MILARRHWCVLMIGCIGWLPCGKAWSLDARQVFEKGSLSTALIQDLDCSGSGIVLNESGLILTNFHVVAAHISLKVKLKARFGNNIALTEVPDVKVLKVHPKYDLALLQATLPTGAKLIPAQIIPKEPPLTTGTRCFAIGNPGGPDGKALELSVTEGLVSSASRNVDGLDYVQVSAALNHGNSGGPIYDDQGRVFAIATWKMLDTEGIAFGIPTQKLIMSDFVELAARKPNMALASEAEKAGGKYLQAAMSTSGAERQALIDLSCQCYRVSLEACPNDATPYHNLGVVMEAMGVTDLAIKYYEAALKQQHNYAASCTALGSMLIRQSSANHDKALALWFEGLTDASESFEAGRCAQNIAVTMINDQKFMASAYALQWADILLGDKVDPDHTDHLWRVVQKQIPMEEFNAIRAKRVAFAKADFDAVIAGKSLISLTRVPTSSGLLGPAAPTAPGAAPAPANDLSTAQVSQVAKLAADAYATQKVAVPAEGLELPLPDAPRTIMLANSGWHVAMHLPNLGKVGIFNLAAAKFDGFIDCPDPQPMLAAGGKLLTMYLPETDTFEIYDVTTLQKRLSKKNPLPAKPIFISMGLLNGMRIFSMCSVPETGVVPFFISLPTMAPVELRVLHHNENDEKMISYDKSARMGGGMDESGARCIAARWGVTGGNSYELKPGGIMDCSHDPLISLSSRLSANGASMIDQYRVRSFAGGTTIYPIPNSGMMPGLSIIAPVAGASHIVEGRVGLSPMGRHPGKPPQGGFKVMAMPTGTTLSEIPADNMQMMKVVHMNPGNDEGRILASAYSDRLVYVLPGEQKIHVYSLGLKAGGEGDSPQPGKHFERKIAGAEGASIALQSGPPGMIYDASKGALEWDVPATESGGGRLIQVILLVTGKDGKQDYKVEKITMP